MSDVIRIEPDRASLPVLPERPGISIRSARLLDYGFIDALQKKHSKAVGFMWEKAIKGHIEKGNVLVAEVAAEESEKCKGESEKTEAGGDQAESPASVCGAVTRPVGYILGADRYLKRDELGIIYQLNVAPGNQRHLVGAHLLKAKFECSAYGCRLYCCWCAQDLAANRFWEAMGFVPLAFRTGGGRKRGFDKEGNFRGRVHIFWQKRIRARKQDGRDDDIPYWFPSLTGAGAIGEDRIVLPIPPGSHWGEAKPIVLPEGPTTSGGGPGTCGGETSGGGDSGGGVRELELEVKALERERKQRVKQRKQERAAAKQASSPKRVERGGLRFGAPLAEQQAQQDAERAAEAELKEAKRAARKAKKKFDPAQEAFARELKDRWLEEVQARPALLEDLEGNAKYDVRRLVAPPGSSAPAPGSAAEMLGVSEVRRLKAA